MSFGSPYAYDDYLTEGVMSRRCVAWLIDVLLIALLIWTLWWVLVLFGLLTLGLGIVGAFVATLIGQAVGWYRPDQGAGVIAATVGAIVVLFVWNRIAASRRPLR